MSVVLLGWCVDRYLRCQKGVSLWREAAKIGEQEQAQEQERGPWEETRDGKRGRGKRQTGEGTAGPHSAALGRPPHSRWLTAVGIRRLAVALAVDFQPPGPSEPTIAAAQRQRCVCVCVCHHPPEDIHMCRRCESVMSAEARGRGGVQRRERDRGVRGIRPSN